MTRYRPMWPTRSGRVTACWSSGRSVSEPIAERRGAGTAPDHVAGVGPGPAAPVTPAGRTGGLLIPPDLEASIVLLRHGESVFITEGRFQGQADSPLSPLGERQ